MINDVAALSGYVERVFERTQIVAEAVPAAQLDWSPAKGELSASEIIRHIASARLMNGRAVAHGIMRYNGHTAVLGASRDDVLGYLQRPGLEVRTLLVEMDPDRLTENVPGQWLDVPGWRRVLGMIEHEIHHRSQLCSYLTQLGIAAPPLFDIFVENLPT
jgi:hypothetical protein